jgi:hypothetical protein
MFNDVAHLSNFLFPTSSNEFRRRQLSRKPLFDLARFVCVLDVKSYCKRTNFLLHKLVNLHLIKAK